MTSCDRESKLIRMQIKQYDANMEGAQHHAIKRNQKNVESYNSTDMQNPKALLPTVFSSDVEGIIKTKAFLNKEINLSLISTTFKMSCYAIKFLKHEINQSREQTLMHMQHSNSFLTQRVIAKHNQNYKIGSESSHNHFTIPLKEDFRLRALKQNLR